MNRRILRNEIVDGKYALGQMVGVGRQGAVYEAKDLETGKRLAIKFLHSSTLGKDDLFSKLQKEVHALSALKHENIVSILDTGRFKNEMPYLVMEYLEGSDLGKLLDVEGTLDTNRAVGIAIQILQALIAIHGAGIIHNNLTPKNIFLLRGKRGADHVKLMDLSIAKYLSNDKKSPRVTLTDLNLGMEGYLSPEQLSGDRNISPTSDIYSVGVVLSVMVTGRLPDNKPDHQRFLHELQTTMPSDPLKNKQAIPRELVEVIEKATAETVGERFNSCLEFRRSLLPFAKATTEQIAHESAQAEKRTEENQKEGNDEEVLMNVRDIGFASNLERGKRSLHIQTEVITATGMKVKTTILDRGLVLDTIVSPKNNINGDLLEQIKKTAKLQHEEAVNKVKKGRYD